MKTRFPSARVVRNRRRRRRPFSLIFLKNVLFFLLRNVHLSYPVVVFYPTNRDRTNTFVAPNDTDLGASKLSALLTDEGRRRERERPKTADATTLLRAQRVCGILFWLYPPPCFGDNYINLCLDVQQSSVRRGRASNKEREKYIYIY